MTAAGESLIAKAHPQSEDIRTKLDGVGAERKALADALDARRAEIENALALFKFNGAVADVQTALRDTESKLNSTEEPSDYEAAEALLRKHDVVKAEIETNGRRLAAVEVLPSRTPCSRPSTAMTLADT